MRKLLVLFIIQSQLRENKRPFISFESYASETDDSKVLVGNVHVLMFSEEINAIRLTDDTLRFSDYRFISLLN